MGRIQIDMDVDIRKADAFEEMKHLEEDFASCAVVDFPWEFDTENGANRYGYDRSNREDDLYEVVSSENLEFTLEHLGRIVEDGGWIFIFADDEKYPMFRECVESSELIRRQTVYWDSEVVGMGYYHRVQAYPIVCATNGETERRLTSRSNIYRERHIGQNSEYMTEKPVGLLEQMLEPPVLEKGETVFEPFAGTFPAGVVAARRECGALGFDVDDRALEIAKERVEQNQGSSVLDY